jgi:biotin transport system substrate-specific component
MRRKSKPRTLAMCALMAGVLAVLSPFTVPLGPVPLSLAVFAVCLCGALLPPPAAAAALAVYVCLGALGLPVFSSFQGGPQVLLGPTGGYILGYFVLALATSFAKRRSGRRLARLAPALAGMAGCYLLGTLWFMAFTGSAFAEALAVCVLPFALWDVLKIGLALELAAALERRLARRAV